MIQNEGLCCPFVFCSFYRLTFTKHLGTKSLVRLKGSCPRPQSLKKRELSCVLLLEANLSCQLPGLTPPQGFEKQRFAHDSFYVWTHLSVQNDSWYAMSKGQADRGKTNQWPLPWTIIWCFIALKHRANHNFVYARNAHRVYDCLFVNTIYHHCESGIPDGAIGSSSLTEMKALLLTQVGRAFVDEHWSERMIDAAKAPEDVCIAQCLYFAHKFNFCV